MDPGYITPFITSLKNVFQTVLQRPVTVGQPALSGPEASGCAASAVIEITGDVEGAVTLSFPHETAGKLAAVLSGEASSADDAGLADAAAELAKMVSRAARAIFAKDTGRTISIGAPSSSAGGEDVRGAAERAPAVVLPCTCECGEFSVAISLAAAEGAGEQPRKAAA